MIVSAVGDECAERNRRAVETAPQFRVLAEGTGPELVLAHGGLQTAELLSPLVIAPRTPWRSAPPRKAIDNPRLDSPRSAGRDPINALVSERG